MTDIAALLRDSERPIRIVAPMVRYSKLPFRLLCLRWGADVVYTPMIIAESFNRSEIARDSDFSTSDIDRPLVVQFATNQPQELAFAVEKVRGFVDAVDVNCGCPQRWAVKDGIGAALSAQPQKIYELVAAVQKFSENPPISVKIRLHKDMRRTIEVLKAAEKAGASWISVHGRTVEERSRVPVHLDAIKLVKEQAQIPVIANGDVFQPEDIDRIANETKCDGIMSARGILANPALYAGYKDIPMECIIDYLKLALEYGGKFSIHHHHLLYMLYRHLSRPERLVFAQLTSMLGILDFFEDRGWWSGFNG